MQAEQGRILKGVSARAHCQACDEEGHLRPGECLSVPAALAWRGNTGALGDLWPGPEVPLRGNVSQRGVDAAALNTGSQYRP